MLSRLGRSVLLAVALAVAAGPAFADPAPASDPAPAVQDASGCALAIDLLAPDGEAAVCNSPAAGTPDPVQPEFLAQGFRGYCRCSCSLTKNCNTSADCGGSACLGGVTCC